MVVCNGKTDDQKLDDYMNHIKSPIMSLSFKKDDYPILNRAERNGRRMVSVSGITLFGIHSMADMMTRWLWTILKAAMAGC